jgi:hypothetical protein
MAAISTTIASDPGVAPRSSLTTRLRVALSVAVFALAVLVLGVEAGAAGFEADEADYVATSRYFGYLFLQGDVARKAWGSNHWTRTQPPLTRYIVGAWLSARGYDLEKLNQPYVSTASSFEVNRQKGRVPTDDVLASARQPMVLLGAGAITMLFLLGTTLGGTATGLVTAALALSSPFVRYTLVHVWAEAPLALFLVLAALLAAIGLKRVLAGGSVLAWGIALGVALGLASATKLTGLVGLVALSGAAALAAVWLVRAGRSDAARRLVAWSAISCIVAVVLFVAVNPYLWRGPIDGVVGMLEERRDEMAFQQEQWPEYAVLSWTERPWLTLSGSLQVGPLAETPAAALVNLPFLVVGVAGAAMLLRQGGPISPTGMLVTWMLGYAVAIVMGLGLKYPRYFMPTTLLFLPVLALGFVMAGRAVWHRASQIIVSARTQKIQPGS